MTETTPPPGLPAACARIVAHKGFVNATTLLILFAAALMGVETDAALVAANKPLFTALNVAVQVLFVVEMSVRLTAHWPRLGTFFRDGWNVFDFLVVVVSLLPAAGPMATVVRLARILRVVRLASVSAELRLIIETMLRSIPSMGNVAFLLGILMYVYSVLGVYQFARTDPVHWGNLGLALQSCFQMLTLEGWVELQKTVAPKHPYAPWFFGSYILVAVFVVVNLFIAIVLNNLENAKLSMERESSRPAGDLHSQIAELREQLDRFEEALRRKA